MQFLQKIRSQFKGKFAVFSVLIGTSLFLALCLFLSFTYTFKRQIENDLTASLLRAKESLTEKFSATETIAKNMNSEIALNPTNKEHIRNVLQKFRAAPELKENFSWTIFSWVNANYFLTVDGEYGVMKKPIDLAQRDYLPLTKLNPNQLYFGSPIFGSTSKKWMIPAGIGAFEERAKSYLGAVIIGFEIEALAKSLFKAAGNDLISIDLYNENGDLILSADSDFTGSKSKILPSDLDEKRGYFQNFFKDGSQEFSEIDLLGNKHAFLVQKLDETPYFMGASYNKKALTEGLRQGFYFRLLEILAMICAATLVIISKNKPLSKEYLRFSVIAACFAVAVSLIFGYFSFQNNSRQNLKLAQSEAKNIESIISEAFDNANQINSYLGQQIAQKGANDLNSIMGLFREAEKINHRSIESLSWSSFDWVDKNAMQKVNSRLGVHKSPIDMSSRLYVDLCPKNPWKLQLSFPTLGNPSNSWVIPTGTGIVDAKGNYLGLISVGFDISELSFKVNQRINQKVSFVVLDENSRIILKSSSLDLPRDSDFFQKNFESKNPEQNSEILEKSLVVGDVDFIYRKKFSNYPYIVLTGFDRSVIGSYFSNFILPRVIEFMVFAIFFLLALHIFKTKTGLLLENEKNLRKAVETANQAKERLIHSISHDIRNYIFGIGGLAGLVLSGQKTNKTLLDEDLELLSDVKEQTEELRFFVEDLLDSSQMASGNFNLGIMAKADLKQLIDKVLTLSSSFIADNGVLVKTDIEPNLPSLYCDPRRMRQILHNLVSNAVKYSKKGGEVLIFAAHQKEQNQIIIEITDQGFGMNEDEVAKYLAGDGGKIDKSAILQSKKIESYGIGMQTVLRLVELHQGRIELESKKDFGTKVRLCFSIS